MLEISNISKKFNQTHVLKDISFSLKSGQIYGLLGNNGAGKTTLTKIIFQEYLPNSGEIIYNSKSISISNYSEWYFFSENNELPKNVRVETYLILIKNLSKIQTKVYNQRIVEILKFLDIKPFFKKEISNLSAGQQKLLSLFVCFLIRPKVIFFDEPTANLDIKNKSLIIEAIKNFKNPDVTIVIITHLIEEVKDILDHILIMDQGKVVYDEINFEPKNLKDIFNRYTTNKVEKIHDIRNYLDAN
ncbi:ATP-binding cassette domain-containing protein [Spiroplasma alleghenense]|uniref:ABC transporter ATP-binding protein n=1 Tax=Spiroplasma alleghenense TaxID=216931 RepID=A0A345Z2N6_9MOLU|nr:ABC transporter ATP-binding protein [Spiroplasma alleghenense]AXK50865.1 ABC transporter ATP-binding protein [Spiroplasma alleghenense]